MRGITIKKIAVVEADPSKAVISFEIAGEKFGKTESPTVKLFNQETGAAFDSTVISHDDKKIVGTAQVPLATKPSKYVFQVTINKADIIAPDHLTDYVVEIKKEEKKPKKAEPFEITFETFKSEQYPNLYSLLITNKNKENNPGFSANPALMKVDIVPPGATNVAIQPGSSPYQMVVTFLAPEKFEVKGVAVTVFDPASTLGNNQPVAFTTPFKEKSPKADPNQHTISNIEILSVQRRSGFGRLKIEGSGFGDYERSPFSGEKELLCCIQRTRDPQFSGEQKERFGSDGKRLDSEVCTGVVGNCEDMSDWRRRIEERVNVLLVPRNPDLRVERTQIMYIDDKVIDVYFEFTYFRGYSEPFRLASATVTVNKGAVQEARAIDDSAEVSAVLSGPQTYISTKEVGPPRDKNLEYRYAILDQKDAGRMFGRGVGQNFYVVELVVVNNGKKKVAVPLGSIQAEIEWLYGESEHGNTLTIFEEGPPTTPPLPLGSVSSYFDAFQKSEGKWAKVFNVLDGVTTLGASLVPVFGRNIERPVTILSGGFIPGLRKAVGDLSGQQLQNLTTMSWENVEEVLPGGSKSKYVYIPRADQFFGNAYKSNDKNTRVRKQIINIRGLEVSGFEILESEQKVATQQR